MKKLGLVLLTLISLAFAAGCGSSESVNSGSPTTSNQETPKPEAGKEPATGEAGKDLTKLKVGYDGFTMTTAPINYANQKGIFKKYGLDVELVYIKAGSTLTQAAIGGDIDIAQNGYTPAAQAIVEGADLTFVGGISNKLPFQMVVKSEITSADQLKGKKIAISKFGSSTDKAAQMALESLGLKKGDVTILQVGGSAERMAAVKSGQVEGTMEQYPQTGDLLKNGFHVMVDLTDLAGEYPNTAYVAKKEFVKQNQETLKKFMMAMTEGIHEYKTNKEEALKSTAEFLKIDDPDSLAETYDFYSQKVYPDIPKPSEKGLTLILEDLAKEKPKAANFKANEIVDVTVFEQLEKEGFFTKYKK